jgi:hypothetical protein
VFRARALCEGAAALSTQNHYFRENNVTDAAPYVPAPMIRSFPVIAAPRAKEYKLVHA